MNILDFKYQYYRDWFRSMTMPERDTEIGIWVFEKVMLFSDLLRQQEKEATQFNNNCRIGNYTKIFD